MRVNNYIVYRIVPFETDVKVGTRVLPLKSETKSNRKLCLEGTLEKHRPKEYPSRSKCLYVCFSKENAFEWAYIKFGRRGMVYKLLTLEVSGELYWFISNCYNIIREDYTQEQLEKACIDYWDSMTENIDDLILDKGYEGLFIGEAVIVAIECKNYIINGESRDVE